MFIISKVKGVVGSVVDKCMTTRTEEKLILAGAAIGTAGVVTHVVGTVMAANVAMNSAAVATGIATGTTVAVAPVAGLANTAVFVGGVATVAKVAMAVGGILVVGGVTSGFIRGIRAGMKASINQ